MFLIEWSLFMVGPILSAGKRHRDPTLVIGPVGGGEGARRSLV